MYKGPSRATNGLGQPLVHSETHCAVYVTEKFKAFLGSKAESVLRYLLGHGWSYCEIYQLTRHNPLIYDATRQMLALHEQLSAAGIDRALIKKILTSRILPHTADATRLVATIQHLVSCGLSQQRLIELIHKKPRILLLTREQIDVCKRASMANGTSFTYYLRKATTASAQCPDRRPYMRISQNKSGDTETAAQSPAIHT